MKQNEVDNYDFLSIQINGHVNIYDMETIEIEVIDSKSNDNEEGDK